MTESDRTHKLDKTHERMSAFNRTSGALERAGNVEHAPEPRYDLPPPAHVRGPVDRQVFNEKQQRLRERFKAVNDREQSTSQDVGSDRQKLDDLGERLERAMEKIRALHEKDREIDQQQGINQGLGLNR